MRGCTGFEVETPSGPLGVVAGVVGRSLEVASRGAAALVPLEQVAWVDTADARIVLRSAPPLRPPEVLPPSEPGCACPSDFRCRGCGYGVAAGHLPRTCPMCGGHAWRPA